MNFPTDVARKINFASVVYKKTSTALPIVTEIFEDVVEDWKSRIPAKVQVIMCVPCLCEANTAVQSVCDFFSVLPSEHCSNSP